MKKFLFPVLALLCCVALPFGALAEGTAPDLIVSAYVVAKTEVAVTAPASGQLAPFSLRAGDEAAAGDVLFAVEPKAVYADIDGTVAAVYAQAGDIADAAASRYGSVLAIEYTNRYEILANTASGYNVVINRNLYVGTPVYLRSANGKYFADGLITAVDGRSFTVAVIGGDLVYTEDVKVYRESDYNDRSLLSRARLSLIQPYTVSASGTIVSMDVQRGSEVKAGDLLFTYVPDVLEPALRGQEDATAIAAEQDLIVTAVNVTQGAAVQKDQVLCIACPAGEYQLLAKIEEGDIASLAVGDTLTAAFEELNLPPIPVTVASISPLGTEEDISRYNVYLDFETPAGVLLGMHATVQP